MHLQTKSYSEHVALAVYYDAIIDLVDKWAEAYQGRHGLIGSIGLQSAKKTTNVTEFLQNQLAEIEESRYKVCAKDDAPLQNLIDGIIELYLRTLYKLKFLS
jgi:hypothetical protein